MSKRSKLRNVLNTVKKANRRRDMRRGKPGAVSEALEARRLLTVSGVGLSFPAAVEGQLSLTAVFSATTDKERVQWVVDWGDGSGFGPPIAWTATSQNFIHGYGEEGTYHVTAIAKDDDPDTGITTTLAGYGDWIVSDASLTSVGTAVSFGATEGTAFTNMPVANFTDAGSGPVGDFSATWIDWGDMNTSAGTVYLTGGTYSVQGNHTYAEDGNFTGTAHVVDDGGSTLNVTFTAVVPEPPTVPKPDPCPCQTDGVLLDPSVIGDVPSPSSGGLGGVEQSLGTALGPEMNFSPTDIMPGFQLSSQPWGRSSDGDGDADQRYTQAGWFAKNAISHVPTLMDKNNNTLIGMVSGAQMLWFQDSGGVYSEYFGYGDTLTDDTTYHQFTLKMAQGYQMVFYDFNVAANGPLVGQFESMTDAAGNMVTASYNGSNQLSELVGTLVIGGVTYTQSFVYSYGSASPNAALVSNILLRTKDSAVHTTYSTVAQTDYTYYSTSSSNGNVGDLMMAEDKDGSGTSLGKTFYRYWNGTDTAIVLGSAVTQPPDAVKIVLGGPSYARALLTFASDSALQSATDAQIIPYADSYYTYDGDGNPASAVRQGAGCSACMGGQGPFIYQTTTNSSPSTTNLFNSWLTRVQVTLPDGTDNYHYYNTYGEEMLSVASDDAGNLFGTFTEYNSIGQPILVAQPAAVDLSGGISELFYTLQPYPDLLNNTGYYTTSPSYAYLAPNTEHPSTGLITLTDYYGTTTALTTTAGGVAGLVQDVKDEQGQTGTQNLIEGEAYYVRSGGGATIYPVATITDYGTTGGGDAHTTTYTYNTWYSGTVQPQSVTVTYPTISSGQNGPGSADSESTYYDTSVPAIWTKDADGHVNYTVYDPQTGAVIKTITDVTSSTLTGADATSFTATGWSATTGVNLVTTYTVDDLGRTTQEIDPNTNVTDTVYLDTNHEVRVYPGWQLITSTATSVGTTSTLIYSGLSASASYVGYTLRITAGTDSSSTLLTVTAYDPSTHKLTFSPSVSSNTDTTSAFKLAGTTGPIMVQRQYWPAANAIAGQQTVYNETLSTNAAPAIDANGNPTGGEVITASNIQSLSRDLTNRGDQTIESDRYYVTNLAGLTYSTASAYLGSPYASNLVTQAYVDMGTIGTWFGGTPAYGSEGNIVVGDTAAPASYATVTPSGNSTTTWTGPGTDPKLLLNPTLTTHSNSYWYNTTSFTVNVNMTGNAHKVALYLVDFDSTTREERIDVTDATTGSLIDTRTLTNFSGGQYVVYTLTGNVTFTFTCLAGATAVLSGIFFDPAGAVAYYPTFYHYDDGGRQDRVQSPTGTISDIFFDATGRPISQWVGTNDVPDSTHDDWSPSTMGSAGNMADVADFYYDSSGTTTNGVGDSDLTLLVQHVDTTAADDRVTEYIYDYRDQMVAEKDGVTMVSGSASTTGESGSGVHRPIYYTVYDNLGEAVRTYQYDGDAVNLSDFATAAATDAIPTADAGDVRAFSTASYDDQGRVYQSKTFSVDQSSGFTSLSDSAILALPAQVTNNFYDHRGNLVATYAPGGLATKEQYDGAGRLSNTYSTDGGQLAGVAMNWTNATVNCQGARRIDPPASAEN